MPKYCIGSNQILHYRRNGQFAAVMLFACLYVQVANTNKDTSLKWFKDGAAETRYTYEQSSGVSTLTFPQVPTMLRSGGKQLGKCNFYTTIRQQLTRPGDKARGRFLQDRGVGCERRGRQQPAADGRR